MSLYSILKMKFTSSSQDLGVGMVVILDWINVETVWDISMVIWHWANLVGQRWTLVSFRLWPIVALQPFPTDLVTLGKCWPVACVLAGKNYAIDM